MVTSNSPAPPAAAADARVPLRLRMLEDPPGRGPHGYWWPQSRDLSSELADLVDGMPATSGKVLRAVYSPPDWDGRARRIHVGRGMIKAGCFPADDTQRMQLLMWDHTLLSIVVIPPDTDPAEASRQLLGEGSTESTGAA